jgi:hypothetical protein
MIKVFALKKLLSRFKAHITACAIPSKTFIWLPFMGRISAFAVILPKPMGSLEGPYDDVGSRWKHPPGKA